MRLSRTPADTAERQWPTGGEIARLVVALLVATLLQTTVAQHLSEMIAGMRLPRQAADGRHLTHRRKP